MQELNNSSINQEKSCITNSVIVFLLYWAFYIPGLIFNILYLKEANRYRRITGISPQGHGCLYLLLVIGLIPIILIGSCVGKIGMSKTRETIKNPLPTPKIHFTPKVFQNINQFETSFESNTKIATFTPVATPIPKPIVYRWKKNSLTNEMGDKIETIAVISDNSVQFGFPYNDPIYAKVIIRRHSNLGDDIYIVFISSKDTVPSVYCSSYDSNCSVRVRIDNNTPFNAEYYESEDHEAIFFKEVSKMYNLLSKANKFSVEVQFNGVGKGIFNFSSKE